MFKKALLLTLASLTLILSGCATLMSQENYDIKITSEPASLSYSVTDSSGIVVASGKTPATINLAAGNGYFQAANYVLTVSSPKFGTRKVQLRATIDGWYFGNVFNGFLGFLVIDPLTGAMWKLPSRVNVDMNSNSLKVRNYGSLNEDERAELVPVPTMDE